MKQTIIAAIALTFTVMSCKKSESQTSEQTTDSLVSKPSESLQVSVAKDSISTQENPNNNFDSFTVNDALAEKIKTYLTTEYLKKDDLNVMTERDRKFQLYELDLNDDGKKEIFVNFSSPYFCGTGGCTVLLLSPELKKITNFTVMETPIFAERKLVNGWKMLMTKNKGEWKELTYKNGTYPFNPSVAPKSPYDAPSGNAFVIFGEETPAKTYSF